MGRIDPAAPRRTRGPASAAGWIVAGALAIALAVLLAFQAGKRSGPDRVPPGITVTVTVPLVVPGAQAVQPAAVESEPTPAPTPSSQSVRLEQAVMDVTLPTRPAVLEAVSAPTAPQAETMREKMVRCPSFGVVDDLIHSTVSRETSTQVQVSVRNSCDFSFAGADVWYEILAIPRRGGGTGARKVGQFSGGPIEAKSRAELVDVLECPACYEESYRYEARLWWGSSDGRTE